jgi:hypothetical protein
MRLRVVAVSLLAVAGCASSTSLENDARVHSLRADAAAQTRDYERAAHEKREAEWLHAKAVKRAYEEGRGDVYVPADVPASAVP